MFVLGFSSGLPFLLVGNTLGYWLRDAGFSLTAIGFATGVGVTYSFKWLWAPLIDRIPPPVFGWLGHRRGWMLMAQIVVIVGLIGMAATGAKPNLTVIICFAALVAFGSASQDIVIDAWRIESAKNSDDLALLTSTITFGYRIALLSTDAIILVIAEYLGWGTSYALYAVLMLLGVTACLLATEPEQASAILDEKAKQAPLWTGRGLFDTILGPFIAFFKAHGWLALLMLLAISLYRLPDFLMGPMVNPFYHDIGLTKSFVGGVRGTFGLFASLAGIAAGGYFAARYGLLRALVVGGVLQALSIAAFALLAHQQPDHILFFTVMATDSFATSFAGVVLVAYMSSLTSLGYTATQYALLASAYTFVGKFLKMTSGVTIDTLKLTFGLMDAYAIFFVIAGLIGIPAILLFVLLASQRRPGAAASKG